MFLLWCIVVLQGSCLIAWVCSVYASVALSVLFCRHCFAVCSSLLFIVMFLIAPSAEVLSSNYFGVFLTTQGSASENCRPLNNSKWTSSSILCINLKLFADKYGFETRTRIHARARYRKPEASHTHWEAHCANRYQMGLCHIHFCVAGCAFQNV